MTDIRPARISDASRPAQLSGVLGYPVSTDSMARRLGRVLARAEDVIFVAGSPTGITEAVVWVDGWSLPSRRGQPRADWRRWPCEATSPGPNLIQPTGVWATFE